LTGPYRINFCHEQVERMILVDIGGESTGAPSGDPMKSRPEVFDSPVEIETWLRPSH
jgi:hypothetical protein